MKIKNTITRKDFLRNSALAVAAVAVSPVMASNALNENSNKISEGNSIKKRFKNVRLETGFEYHGNEVIATKTNLFSVEVENGKIASISENNPNLPNAIDAKGLLMLPAFKDMHIHLDKTFYGEKWQAVRPRTNGLKGIIALEQEILPGLLKNSTQKAEKMIELLQSKGSNFARSHVNIEPTSGLQSLKNLEKALEHKKESFAAELVAFPQHGLFYTASAGLMKEAAQQNIDFIGGLDPYSIDGSVEKPMDFTLQLALDYNKGIDIHLHETKESGLQTVEYLIKKVNENPVLKGKTFLSHCFILSRLESKKVNALAEQLADAQIGIISTVPSSSVVMPLPTLLKHKVNVSTGNDSIVDHWNTFGSGSVLEKANLMAQIYGMSTEFKLSRAMQIATNGVLPLSDSGQQQWPKQGDVADFIFINASCSAEAVSRISEVRSLVHQGKIVY